jgi:hypothetical protein
MKSSSSGFVRLRLLTGLAFCLAGAFLAVTVFAQRQKVPQSRQTQSAWPSVDQQLTQEYLGRAVESESALEKLIRDNQDFSILRDGESADKLRFPPWLRVWWRKAHPDENYSGQDPTGGYPRALNEILEWMMTHQDLKDGPGVQEKSSDADPDATIASNVRISGSQSASRSESDIRINYFDSSKIISASNNITSSGKQAIYYSTDGGTSWAQTALPATGTDTSHSDPTVDWTSDGTAWSATLGIQGNSLRFRNYFSLNNGATWTFDATASGSQTSVDKEMIWVDHSASSTFQNQIYAIWHNSNPAFMNRRTAGAGGTWLAAPIQVSGAETTGTAIGGDVKTNSAGDVFGAWPDTGSRGLYLAKSTNGGSSFAAPVKIATTYDSYDIGVPSFSSRRALIYVTLGAFRSGTANNVYATWTDLSGVAGCNAAANEPGTSASSTCKTRIWFSRSTTGGLSWSAPIKINDQAGLNDQFNQWMAVDETSGAIAVMYYDTVGDAARKKTDIWYQSSVDGVVWSTPQKVTAAMTDESISGADSGNQYGDYNGLSAYGTLVFPSWTDRRNNAKEEIWTSRIVDTHTPTAAVAANGSAITAGNCGNPTTSSIESGETVTLNICVRNDGDLATTPNLVGTLQATGGVTSPSAAQNYGIIAAGGGSACRSFTFKASGACGSTLTATLQLQDGANNLGIVAYKYTLGTPVVRSTENFDGVVAPALPNNWSAMNATGSAPLWATSTTTPDSGANAAFVDDPAAVSDKLLDWGPITISTAQATVTFRNNYNLEPGFDGGVLEVSSPNIVGGAFTDITSAAVGGSFVSGGYNGTISTGYSNPLAGRSAWTGNAAGYVTTVANLGPNVAGQKITLRFRMGSDTIQGATGWRIDSVTIQDGYSCPCAPLPLSVVSRKLHGGQNFDVNLPLSGTPGIEPRTGGAGGNHQIVVTFASPVTAGAASIDSGNGNISNFNASGSELTLNLDSVADQQSMVISVSGMSDGTNAGTLSIPVSFLVGDANGDGTINSADATLTRNGSGQSADATNFRMDFNTDGTINSADATLVRALSGHFIP